MVDILKSSTLTESEISMNAPTESFDSTPGDRVDPRAPFMAATQATPGQLDLRVFNQAEYWVDTNSVGHALEDMSADYRLNVLLFLLEDPQRFHLAMCQLVMAENLVSVLGGRVPGDLIARELGAPGVHEISAEVWIEATPLVRRLRTLTGVHRPPSAA